ncbi:hypothetical protein P5V15_009279 [Pogonomyrmex californicus]
MNDCAIRLPSEDDKWLTFKNHTNKKRLPVIIYADLECVLRRMEPGEKEGASYTYSSTRYLALDTTCDACTMTCYRRIDFGPAKTALCSSFGNSKTWRIE